MKIIVDYRERKSGIIRDLASKGFEVDVKALPMADFIVETKDKEGKVHTLGIEKKTQVEKGTYTRY